MRVYTNVLDWLLWYLLRAVYSRKSGYFSLLDGLGIRVTINTSAFPIVGTNIHAVIFFVYHYLDELRPTSFGSKNCSIIALFGGDGAHHDDSYVPAAYRMSIYQPRTYHFFFISWRMQ